MLPAAAMAQQHLQLSCQVTEWSHPKLGCAQVLLLQPLSLGQVAGKDVQAASIF